jgi:hypothetical protein
MESSRRLTKDTILKVGWYFLQMKSILHKKAKQIRLQQPRLHQSWKFYFPLPSEIAQEATT